MSRPRALVLAAAMAAVPAVAQEPLLASQLDYSLNAARDVPIACKAGRCRPRSALPSASRS